MRRAARRDENEPEIRDELNAVGVMTHALNDPGVPDLLCWGNKTGVFLLEIIGAAKASRYRKSDGLTPSQEQFWGWWPGPLYKASSVEEALEVVRELEEKG